MTGDKLMDKLNEIHLMVLTNNNNYKDAFAKQYK